MNITLTSGSPSSNIICVRLNLIAAFKSFRRDHLQTSRQQKLRKRLQTGEGGEAVYAQCRHCLINFAHSYFSTSLNINFNQPVCNALFLLKTPFTGCGRNQSTATHGTVNHFARSNKWFNIGLSTPPFDWVDSFAKDRWGRVMSNKDKGRGKN